MTTEAVVSKKPNRDWKDLVTEWLKSGYSISAYCRDHHLPQATFHYWKNKFAPNVKLKNKRNVVPTKQNFIPIQVCNDKNTNEYKGILLRYPNGCSIYLDQEFNPTLLRLITEAMGVK